MLVGPVAMPKCFFSFDLLQSRVNGILLLGLPAPDSHSVETDLQKRVFLPRPKCDISIVVGEMVLVGNDCAQSWE